MEYSRRINLMHGMPTPGQRDAVIREIIEWEKATLMAGIEQETEYLEIQRLNEIYANLINEGNKEDGNK